jgi:hypothetical protein
VRGRQAENLFLTTLGFSKIVDATVPTADTERIDFAVRPIF